MSLNSASVSHFDSIQSFQAYFRENDALFLPADQPLEIRNISNLTNQEDDPFEAKEILPKEISQLVLYILHKMVLPLAKTIEIQFSDHGKLRFDIGDNFYLSFSKRVTLKVQKGPIRARLTDLFKLMIASSISKMEFVPNQDLIVLGITEKEWKLEATVGATIDKILSPRVPAGFKAIIEFKGKGDNCQVSNGWFTYGSAVQQRSFTIRSSYKWNLTLSESGQFLFSMDGFRRRMKIKDELMVPANQILRIQDEAFLSLHDQYSDATFTASNFAQFALNQIFLPLGRTVEIVEHGTNGYELKWGDDFLEISAVDGFTLKTQFGHLWTKLTDLGRFLISNHVSSLVLHPQQRLYIHSLTEAQKKQLATWVTSTDLETVKTGFEGFFMPYNPIGFIWQLKWIKDFDKALVIREKDTPPLALMLRSSERLELNLERASGEWLVLNLINNSSSELLQSILEADEKAFIYILFKAMFYYCCDDFRHFRKDELPGFFKETTQLKLLDLLKNNLDFTESLRLVIGSEEMYSRLSKLLRSSPEEFDKLHLETLPAPLQTLMRVVMKLVYEELQGSPFIAQSVQIITKGLTDGSLKNLLRPPIPEKANSPQSSSESTETIDVNENQIVSTVGKNSKTVPIKNPAKIQQLPSTPSPGIVSRFLSFVWTIISRLSRFVSWLLKG